MMWLAVADRLHDLIVDIDPQTDLECDQYASLVMDYEALRAMGSAALARAARGEKNVPALSVLKVFGAEAEVRGAELGLHSVRTDGLIHPATSGPYAHMNPDNYYASWFERHARGFSTTIAGGTSDIHRNVIAQRLLGLPPR
jgi:alkylation response protein AidB-like acyl-CoA dehydrogenase